MADLSLAWLREPHHDWALSINEFCAAPPPRGLAFFAPDFALNNQTPWLCGEACAWPTNIEPKAQPPIARRVAPSAVRFDQLHEEILERIGRKEFAKVVPIVVEDVEFAGPLAAEMFPRTLERHGDQYAYGFSRAAEGLCGVTPELLFAVDGDELRTMALAGTGPVDGPSLLEIEKERREHQLVIDHIVGELKSWGTPDVGTTAERTYGALKHLRTPIQMRLRARPTFMELIVKLHPTAALGGWPRRPAIEWLEAQEFHRTRGRFGAPFGLVDGGRWRAVVAIRGLQWRGRRARIAAGCGVVEGSESLKEWRELALKRGAIYRFVGLEG